MILYSGKDLKLAYEGFLGGSVSKESACNAGHPCLIPGLGRSLGEGNGNPLQYSCWRIPWLQSMVSKRAGHN